MILFAGWLGEQALVEHSRENVNVSLFFLQHVLIEVGEVEVDNYVINVDCLLQGLVVLEGDGDGVTLANRVLAKLVGVLQLIGKDACLHRRESRRFISWSNQTERFQSMDAPGT